MKRFLAFALGLTLCFASCNRSSSSSESKEGTASEEKASAATISASPNPVPAGPKLGETTITWDTGNKQTGEVYVSTNDGPEKRFGEGQSGSEKAKWIQVRSRYEFRLYEGTEHKKVLAKVQVTHKS